MHECKTNENPNGEDPDKVEDRLNRIEATLQFIAETLKARRIQKEWYTTKEAAELLEKKPYTVREWCRHGRIHAEKAQSGRGLDDEWRISHEEIDRIGNLGLLPIKRRC